MGVIALGIGFATPLALTGVAVHIAGHAIAKALGFYAATPLLGHERRAGGHAVTGIGRTEPTLGTAMGISLGTLAGMPPSPLFVSELLIVAGGFEGGLDLGGRRGGPSARARIRRPRPRADRDDGRLTPTIALPGTVAGLRGLRPLTAVSRDPPARAHGRRALARRHQRHRRASRGTLVNVGTHTEAAAYRSTVEEALDASWRFAGLHAARNGSVVRALLVDEAGTTRLETLETPSRRGGLARRPRARRLGRARGIRSLRRDVPGPRAAPPARRPRCSPACLDRSCARRRCLPGGRRADSRRA